MKLFTGFLIFLILVGCVTRHTKPPLPILISTRWQKQNLIEDLHKAGVQVIQLGDELRLIIPANRFFIKNTPKLKSTATSSLNKMVVLLNQQKNFGINVLAYSVSLEDFKPNVSLEQQQAQTLVNYFLQQGLNTRLIIASAWKGLTARQKQGTGRFSDDTPVLFSVEVRTRLLQAEDIK